MGRVEFLTALRMLEGVQFDNASDVFYIASPIEINVEEGGCTRVETHYHVHVYLGNVIVQVYTAPQPSTGRIPLHITHLGNGNSIEDRKDLEEVWEFILSHLPRGD